jgi:hypothetical protein
MFKAKYNNIHVFNYLMIAKIEALFLDSIRDK